MTHDSVGALVRESRSEVGERANRRNEVWNEPTTSSHLDALRDNSPTDQLQSRPPERARFGASPDALLHRPHHSPPLRPFPTTLDRPTPRRARLRSSPTALAGTDPPTSRRRRRKAASKAALRCFHRGRGCFGGATVRHVASKRCRSCRSRWRSSATTTILTSRFHSPRRSARMVDRPGRPPLGAEIHAVGLRYRCGSLWVMGELVDPSFLPFARLTSLARQLFASISQLRRRSATAPLSLLSLYVVLLIDAGFSLVQQTRSARPEGPISLATLSRFPDLLLILVLTGEVLQTPLNAPLVIADHEVRPTFELYSSR